MTDDYSDLEATVQSAMDTTTGVRDMVVGDVLLPRWNDAATETRQIMGNIPPDRILKLIERVRSLEAVIKDKLDGMS